MAIPNNKVELLKAISDNHKRLQAELSSFPLSLTKNKELEGHSKNTMISINELIAYLIGWGQLVLKWNRRKEMGLEVDFPDSGYQWNELGKLAQKFYKDHENEDFRTLMEKFDATTREIISLVERKTNDELYKSDWYGKWTLGRMIQLNTSSPFKNARLRIRNWKKSKDL